MSRRSLMLQPSLADVSKLAPFPQLGQACKILFGCEQACQKLREFFVNKDAVAYEPDEGRSRLCRDSVALRTMLAFIHLYSQNTNCNRVNKPRHTETNGFDCANFQAVRGSSSLRSPRTLSFSALPSLVSVNCPVLRRCPDRRCKLSRLHG
jgi:hypothetical protein